jgi:2-desacetyl-2-hydroxyethyl bacteriochlorophyllide A dehydrogenase
MMLDSDLSLAIGERELADPAGDEALVRVRWAGLCGSDLHVLRTGDWVQQWPATLGHEICGTVEVTPADGDLRQGDFVIADSRVPCEACSPCLAGDPDHCEAFGFVGEVRPGGFAGHCVLPVALLHRVPDALCDCAAAVLSEPLAVAIHALSLLRAEPRHALVIGHGPVGALTHIELRRCFPQAVVDVAEPIASRAALARATGARVVASVDELADSRYDTVIDAAGFGGSLARAIALVRPRGQVLVLAITRRPVEITPADLVEGEIAVLGSNAFTDELPQAITQLAADRMRYEPVITDTIALPDLPAAIERQLARPEAIKLVVSP